MPRLNYGKVIVTIGLCLDESACVVEKEENVLRIGGRILRGMQIRPCVTYYYDFPTIWCHSKA